MAIRFLLDSLFLFSVILFDTSTDKVVNADMFSLSLDAAIEGVESDDERHSITAHYTIDGRRVLPSF